MTDASKSFLVVFDRISQISSNGENVMVMVSLGNKKKRFRSIKEAAEACGVSYMTLYMRLRMGQNVRKAIKQPVRAYNKKAA